MADVGTILDNIEKEGKSLVDQAKKLTDLAYKMSPEGIAAEKASKESFIKKNERRQRICWMVFLVQDHDGYFRAIVRPSIFGSRNMKLEELNWQTIL